MSQERKLASLFRSFVEKVFLPRLHTSQGVLQDWCTFSSLISSPALNVAELQAYVDALPPLLPPALPDRRELPLWFSNRRPPHGHPESLENSFHPSRTFGGERAKNIVIAIRQQEKEEPHSQAQDQYGQDKICPPTRDHSEKLPVASLPNITTPNPQNYHSGGVRHMLDRLLKRVAEDQRIIDVLQSKMGGNNTIQIR